MAGAMKSEEGKRRRDVLKAESDLRLLQAGQRTGRFIWVGAD